MVFARVAEYLTGSPTNPLINDAVAREGANITDTRRQTKIMEPEIVEEDPDAARPAYPHVCPLHDYLVLTSC